MPSDLFPWVGFLVAVAFLILLGNPSYFIIHTKQAGIVERLSENSIALRGATRLLGHRSRQQYHPDAPFTCRGFRPLHTTAERHHRWKPGGFEREHDRRGGKRSEMANSLKGPICCSVCLTLVLPLCSSGSVPETSRSSESPGPCRRGSYKLRRDCHRRSTTWDTARHSTGKPGSHL